MNAPSIGVTSLQVGVRAVSLRSPAPAPQPTVYLVFIDPPDKHPGVGDNEEALRAVKILIWGRPRPPVRAKHHANRA